MEASRAEQPVDEGVLTSRAAATWADVLARRRAYFAHHDISYQTLVIPDAHLVYRDRLADAPDGVPTSAFERLERVLDSATWAQCVYPRAELVQGRSLDETYALVDGLWTDWGSWLGYRASVEALAVGVPGIRVLESGAVDWSVSPAARSLGDNEDEQPLAAISTASIRNPSSRLTLSVVTELGETLHILEQDAPDLPSAVVFRDALMTGSAKFYAESFRRTVFVSSANSVFYDLVAQEMPDVVIHELAERSLVAPPVEPSTIDFRFMFGDLLLADTEAVDDQRTSRALANVGRVAEALVASDDVLRRVPPNARMLVRRARLHLQTGHGSAAIETLRHANTLDPLDGAAWCSLGQALAQQGRLGDSAEAHAKAARAEPIHVLYWHLALSAALRAKDLVLAEELRNEAVALHGDNAQLASAASWVLAATGRLEEAEEAAELALRAEPGTVETLWQLASIQMRRQRWDAAEMTVDRLGRLLPGDPEVRRYLEVVRRASASAAPAVEGAS